jgi:hypothetical protein
MGFNKRYITKEMIMSNIDDESYIVNLTNADALIIDHWSSKFLKNFNYNYSEYQSIRESLNTQYRLSSNLSDIQNSIDFGRLKKLSNVFINLKRNPTWLDIILASEILNFKFEYSLSGVFNEMLNFALQKIEEYYNNI